MRMPPNRNRTEEDCIVRRPTTRPPKRDPSSQRNGVATIEFAVILPVMILITFASIQMSDSILLRHKSVAIMELGTLDFMLGTVGESELATHIETLATDAGLTDVDVSVAPASNANYLNVEIAVPITGNTECPIVIPISGNVGTNFLVYRHDDS